MNNTIKTTISLTLVFSIILPTSFSIYPPKTAEAVSENSILVAQTFDCVSGGVVSGAINDVKNKAKDIAKEKINEVKKEFQKKIGGKVKKEVTNAATDGIVAGPIPTDPQTLIPIEKEHSELTRDIKKKEDCLDGIIYMTARVLLSRMTTSVVNWVNNGANGSPLYITDRGIYLKNASDLKTQLFMGELSKTTTPFTSALMKSVVVEKQIQNSGKLDIKLGYNLDKIAGSEQNAKNFTSGDFNACAAGGLKCFSALANENNNVMGLYTKVSQELKNEETKATENADKKIVDGFIPVEKCIKYAEDANEYGERLCEKTETVTPASNIISMLNQAVTSTYRQQEGIDETTKLLASVFESFNNRFLSKSLREVSTQSSNGQYEVDSKKELITAIDKATSLLKDYLSTLKSTESILSQSIAKIKEMGLLNPPVSCPVESTTIVTETSKLVAYNETLTDLKELTKTTKELVDATEEAKTANADDITGLSDIYGKIVSSLPSDEETVKSKSDTDTYQQKLDAINTMSKNCLDEKKAIDAMSTTPLFTEADREAGWYFASKNQLRAGTPSNWLHRGEGTKSAMWYNPQ